MRAELSALEKAATPIAMSAQLRTFVDNLSAVNQALWDIEDAIRDCERRADFGTTFVELARSVYRRNDERGELKRKINSLLGTRIFEEKQYADYR